MTSQISSDYINSNINSNIKPYKSPDQQRVTRCQSIAVSQQLVNHLLILNIILTTCNRHGHSSVAYTIPYDKIIYRKPPAPPTTQFSFEVTFKKTNVIYIVQMIWETVLGSRASKAEGGWKIRLSVLTSQSQNKIYDKIFNCHSANGRNRCTAGKVDHNEITAQFLEAT